MGSCEWLISICIEPLINVCKAWLDFHAKPARTVVATRLHTHPHRQDSGLLLVNTLLLSLLIANGLSFHQLMRTGLTWRYSIHCYSLNREFCAVKRLVQVKMAGGSRIVRVSDINTNTSNVLMLIRWWTTLKAIMHTLLDKQKIVNVFRLGIGCLLCKEPWQQLSHVLVK